MNQMTLKDLERFLTDVYSSERHRFGFTHLYLLPAPQYVLLGFSPRRLIGLRLVLGWGRLCKELLRVAWLLVRGGTPWSRIGAVAAPVDRRLYLVVKGRKKAFLLLDPDAECAFKAIAEGRYEAGFRREQAALEQYRSIEPRIAPRLIDSGEVPPQNDSPGSALLWMRMSIHPNNRRLTNTQWSGFRDRELTPRLFSAYREIGRIYADLDEYLIELMARARGDYPRSCSVSGGAGPRVF